jgi:hypothetical protein
MNPLLYQKVFTGTMALLAVVMGLPRISSPDNSYQKTGSKWTMPVLLCLGLTFWIGLRPISGDAFGDTANYALEYARMSTRLVSMDWSGEWIWQWLMNGCKALGLSVNVFFTIVAAGYVLSAFWAVKRFMPNDPMLGVVFLLNSLMFFPFGVNGLRNGLACHLVLLGISFLLDDKWVPGVLISLVAFGIHRSTMLPLAAVFVGLFVIRNLRYVIAFWIVSIFISLVAGGPVTQFFAGLGFDDRMTQYTTISDMSEFSKAGFRWDFLLYSAAPIVMAWYVGVKKNLQDNWYNVICTAYGLCNAFWIMVIRSSFSNRFAYLSWFLYPLVIAYPLVNMPIRDDQDRFTGWILLAYSAFSVFMWFVFW